MYIERPIVFVCHSLFSVLLIKRFNKYKNIRERTERNRDIALEMVYFTQDLKSLVKTQYRDIERYLTRKRKNSMIEPSSFATSGRNVAVLVDLPLSNVILIP